MHSLEAVFVTDGVNRHRMLLPIEEMLGSMERPLAAAIERGLPYGMPVNINHDKCRPAGWSIPRGVYIARDVSRQLGTILTPESDQDQELLSKLVRRFELSSRRDEAAPYIDALNDLLATLPVERADLWHVEATGCVAPGLAALLYPDFFSADSPLVDKHGLVDYRTLLGRAEQIHPGVFHEPKRDLLLFAHPFLRRSLSRRNSLNGYFLRSFHDIALAEGVFPRLRLDPDLIALPTSGVHAVMELEYWHGPKYDDDIETIGSGVAEYKNQEHSRDHSGIDRTHIWWKDPEPRRDENSSERKIRTFEIEELIEDPSPGLGNGSYGCRYAHAEYDLTDRTIAHFDGAIRAYPGDAYLTRLDQLIDRAGKQSDYTKLFRLDGTVPVDRWKRVLSDYFRGNQLIPEYLGAPAEELPRAIVMDAEQQAIPALPLLSAYVAIEANKMEAPMTVSALADQRVEIEGGYLTVAEIGRGQVAETLKRWAANVGTMAGKAEVANLAAIALPATADGGTWREVAGPLSAAITADADAGLLTAVSTSMTWKVEGVSVTLSIAGEATRVAQLLAASVPIVRPDAWPSTWVAAFRDALCEHAPELTAPVDWPKSAVTFGRIAIERSGGMEAPIDSSVTSPGTGRE